jgi:hypothetical protein
MRRAKKRRGKKRGPTEAGNELIELSRQWNFNFVYVTSAPTTANVIVKASGIGDAAVDALVNGPAVDTVVRR